MRSFRVPALAAAVFVVACGAASSADVAAKAGSLQLSSARLAEILSSSQAPLDPGVATQVAELWVNYQLAGIAAAKGDTLTDRAVVDDGLWSAIQNMRVRKLYEAVKGSWDTTGAGSNEQRYTSGEVLSARHILVQVPQDATPEQVEAARKKAEDIRAEATPANFVRLAARSDEPGAADRGGDLGLFGAGMMVPEFEQAVRALQPGEISPVVRTSFGFHVIYRKRFDEVASEVGSALSQRNVAVAESTYLANLEGASDVKVGAEAIGLVKNVARNPLGYQGKGDVVATYTGGKLEASRLADWVMAYPPQTQLRPQLQSAPDSLVERFIRQVVRNELLLLQADSAGMDADTAEVANLRLQFRNSLTSAWATMGVDPSSLRDSAGASPDAVAAARIESYFDRLVKNEVPFADVAYPVGRALQKKYGASVNEPGITKALERAQQLRASADSLNATTPPPVPTDSAAAPGGN